MQINLLSLIVMVILGIIVNYSMLKLLTEKVYPQEIFRENLEKWEKLD